MAITEEREYAEPLGDDEDDWDDDFLSEEQQEQELDPESEQFFAQLIERIWAFIVEFAGIETFPFPYQEVAGKRIIESVVKGDGQTLTELFARQSGKTELVANVVAGLMVLLPKLAVMFPHTLGKFKRGFWVGAFAPTDEQVSILFSRVVERLTSERAEAFMAEPEIDDEVKALHKQVKLKRSGSIFRMQTANPRAKIEGRTYHLILIDEAQDVVEFVVTKSIRPMKAFYNGSMVMTGTPQVVKGIFFKTIQINKRLENQRGGKRNHYEFDYKHVCQVNKNYRAHVRQEALELGEDSDEFRLAYKLEWLLDRGMFITEEQFKDLGDKQGSLVHAYFRSPCLVGIDPARKVDSTVVTVIWVDWDRPDDLGYFRHHVLNWLELHGEDWEDQYFRIVEFLSNYNVLAIAVDEQGVGDAVAQRIQVLMPDVQVVPLPSDNTSQSARWKHLMQLTQRQMITWPAHPKTRRLKLWKRFQQQMQDAEKKYEHGHLVVEAPDERGAHDDFPDSLALGCFLSKEFIVQEVEQSSNPMYEHRRR